MKTPSKWLYAIAVLCVAVTGCKKLSSLTGLHGNDVGQGTGKPSQWAMTVTVSKSALTIQQGSSDTFHITIARSGGFTGTVDVTAQIFGIIGMTATISNTVTTGTTTTMLVTVQVNNGFPAGSGPILSVQAKPVADALDPFDIAIPLTVTAKPGVFVSTASSVTVLQGGAATESFVGLQRTQFTDTVNMTLINAPAGVTATFSPNPTVGTNSTMSIRADASVAAGTYTSLGVRANAGLASQATAPLTVVVVTTSPTTVSVSPNALTLARGASTSATITVSRPGTSVVSMRVSGNTGGMSITFNPPGITDTTGTVNITAPAGMPTGTYVITISGYAGGLPPGSTTLTVTVI